MKFAGFAVVVAAIACAPNSQLDTPIARKNRIFLLDDHGAGRCELSTSEKTQILRVFESCVWMKGISVPAFSGLVFELRDEINPDYRQQFFLSGYALHASWRRSVCLLSEEHVSILTSVGCHP